MCVNINCSLLSQNADITGWQQLRCCFLPGLLHLPQPTQRVSQSQQQCSRADDLCHAAVKATGEVRSHGTAASIALHVASAALHAVPTALPAAPTALLTVPDALLTVPTALLTVPIALHTVLHAAHTALLTACVALHAAPTALLNAHIALQATKSTAAHMCNVLTVCTDRQCSWH